MRAALGAESAPRLQELGLARHLNPGEAAGLGTNHTQARITRDPGRSPLTQPSASAGSPERYMPR